MLIRWHNETAMIDYTTLRCGQFGGRCCGDRRLVSTLREHIAELRSSTTIDWDNSMEAGELLITFIAKTMLQLRPVQYVDFIMNLLLQLESPLQPEEVFITTPVVRLQTLDSCREVMSHPSSHTISDSVTAKHQF